MNTMLHPKWLEVTLGPNDENAVNAVADVFKLPSYQKKLKRTKRKTNPYCRILTADNEIEEKRKKLSEIQNKEKKKTEREHRKKRKQQKGPAKEIC